MNCANHPEIVALAYCRTCGKALCEECKRDVVGAIYCEPCIAARLQGVPSAATPVPPVPPVPSSPPNPSAAALLGLVPGVGAMYNGQFIKAFAHVMIFVVLIVAVKHVSGILGILIPFFIFYMAFEAYKTAEANLRGLPGPDPLGLDRLLGVQENQPVTSMGGTAASAQAASGTPVPAQPVPKESTPTAAFILIALGIFFLLGNLDWIHSDRLWPLLLIGLGLWIAYKRTAGHA